MNKIFLFSPTGRVGSRLFKGLVQQGYEVFYKTRKENTLVESVKVDLCIYTAGITADRHERTAKYLVDNAQTALEIVKLCAKHSIDKIIYLSSDEIYGELVTDNLNISSDKVNLNVYAMTKLISERLIIESGMQYNILRLPGIVGAEAADTFLERTINKMLVGDEIDCYFVNRDFNNVVHLDDLLAFIIKLTLIEWDSSHILHLGQQKAVKLLDVLEYIKNKTKSHSPVCQQHNGKRYFLLPTSKAEKLGYKSRGIYKIIDELIDAR